MDDGIRGLVNKGNVLSELASKASQHQRNISFEWHNDADRSAKKMLDDLFSESIAKAKAEEQYKIDVLETLKRIEKNTSSLVDIQLLLRESNDRQAETFDLIVEAMSIMRAESQEEATSKYGEVVRKISEYGGAMDAVQRLMNFAYSAYNTAMTNLPASTSTITPIG